MIEICRDYDVVLTFSPIVELTGHIFECFDYYLFLRRHCRVGILFIEPIKREKLKTAFESKYTADFSEVEKDIVYIDSKRLLEDRIVRFGPKTSVLLTDGNIASLEHRGILLATKKLYGFMCGEYNFENVRMNSRITYLQDYRIYGRNMFFKSVDYVKKLPFDEYRRPPAPSRNIGMMYMTYVCRKVGRDTVEEYHRRSGCSETELLVPYPLSEYDGIPGVVQKTLPVQDFFETFDKYIYLPVKRMFDCSPRLVTECHMLGRETIVDVEYDDPGLRIRLDDCRNRLDFLNLKDGDAILGLLLR